MNRMLISPSILASDFSRLGEECVRAQRSGADMLHIDCMDGHFVPNLTIGAPVVSCLRPTVGITFDVHLMLEEPHRYIEDFAKAGSDIITFHVESASPVAQTIDSILQNGCRAGLSVKPDTPADAIFPFLEKLSLILVMTVEPGFGGQPFIYEMVPKLRAISDECRRRGLDDMIIQVDGGINPETAALCAQNGANSFVAGNSIFKSENSAEAIEVLRTAAENAVK